MQRTLHRGFTLIELLVVIAIIGILSAVVLGSLTLARFKAADSNVKANLHTVQVQMEYIYDGGASSQALNSYGTSQAACSIAGPQNAPPNIGAFSDTSVRGAILSAVSQGGAGYFVIPSGQAGYLVAIPLKADSANWWCIDARGRGKTVPASTMTAGGSTVCAGSVGLGVCP